MGDRKVIDFKVDSNRRTMTETVEIEVRNQKKVVQNVVVREHLYRWRNWEIVERNEPFEKVDSNTVEWNLRIAPEATGRIRYEVVYTW